MRAAARLLLFALLAGLLLFKSFLWDEVYAPAGMLDWFYPWRHYAVQQDVKRPLPFEGMAVRDDLLAAIPQDMYIHRALRSGRLPLWNPDVLCGVPFAAYYRTVWYPPRALLLWAFDPLTGSLLSVFLHLVVAGLGMAWFLRELGLREGPADFGGVVWMLSGYSTAWIEIYYVPIACALLPLLMAGATRLASRRDAASFALTAVPMGLLFVGCHWQFAMYGAAFGAVWLATRLWSGEGRRRWLWVPAVCATALVVGAVQILPTLQLARLASRPPMPDLASVNAQCRLLPEMLATIVVPELFGSQAAGFFWSRVNSPLQSFSELIVYIGIIPLLMVVGAPRSGVRGWRFFAAAAVVTILLATGSPLYALAWVVVPPVRFLTPVRVLWLTAFSMAVLAACGAQRAADSGRLPGGWRGALALLVCIVAVEAAAFTLFVPGGAWFDELVIAYIRYGSFPLPNYANGDAFVSGLVRAMQRHYDPWTLPFLGPLLLAAFLVVLGLLLERRRVSAGVAAGLLVSLTVVDLVGFGLRANPTAPRASLFPPTQATRVLSSAGPEHRIGGVGRMPHPELFLAYGLEDIGGYQSLYPGAVRRLYGRINGEDGNYMIATMFGARHFNHGIADLLGVRLLYTDPGGTTPSWTSPVSTSDLIIRENREALPRLFFVPGHEVLADEDAVIARMTEPTFDPRRGVLLSAPPVRRPEGPSAAGQARLELTRPRPEKLDAAVSLVQPGWVVFSEAGYPGWRARLDGLEVPLETAYAAFMAVAVPSGEHRLQLEFDPPVQRWGMALSLLAWGVGALAVLRGR